MHNDSASGKELSLAIRGYGLLAAVSIDNLVFSFHQKLTAKKQEIS